MKKSMTLAEYLFNEGFKQGQEDAKLLTRLDSRNKTKKQELKQNLRNEIIGIFEYRFGKTEHLETIKIEIRFIESIYRLERIKNVVEECDTPDEIILILTGKLREKIDGLVKTLTDSIYDNGYEDGLLKGKEYGQWQGMFEGAALILQNTIIEFFEFRFGDIEHLETIKRKIESISSISCLENIKNAVKECKTIDEVLPMLEYRIF